MKFYIFILQICTLIFCLLGFSQENKLSEKEILIQQLQAGKYNGGDEFESYKFSEKDVYATFNIITKELENSGYKTITNTEFNDKIKKIFGRIIDNSTQTKFLSVDFFDKCNRNPIYSRLEIFDNIFIIKEKCFITKLYAIPELIDYQKKYPDLKKIEDEVIYRNEPDLGNQIIIPHWKDISDLDQQRKKNIQTLVARNMYLFNDSKAHFKWLILNDAYFMRRLVTVFGYYEDKELLKWVLENTPVFKYGDSKSKFDELSKIFWNKKCDNSYSININLLTIIKELSTPEQNDRIINVFQIAQELVYMTNTVSSFSEIPFKDRAKILAHLLEFGEQYKYNKEYDYNQLFLGRFIYYLDYKKEFITEFKKNNYYDLPNLKKWYELALKEKNIFQDDDSLMGEPDYEDYLSKSRSNQ